VLAALETASDHLPVVADYLVPLGRDLACSKREIVESGTHYGGGTTTALASEIAINTEGSVVVEPGATVEYYAERYRSKMLCSCAGKGDSPWAMFHRIKARYPWQRPGSVPPYRGLKTIAVM